jgi:hypothetical protein
MTVMTRRICVLAMLLSLASLSAMAQEETPVPVEPSSPSAAPAPALTPTLPLLADPVEIMRRTAARDEENDKKGRNYTYVQDVLEKKLDSKGEVKSTEKRRYEVMVIYGEDVLRLVAKDDKPLPPDEAAKEEEKIDKMMQKYKNETEDQRAKRLEKAEKSKEGDRAFVKEIAEAFDFTILSPETVDGHTLYAIQAEPKSGYQPHSKNGKYLTKFRGKIWIDQNEYQWVKLDLETIDTISFGWFVARLHKGTHFYIEQTRVNDEVWLPKLVRLNLGARIALFKDLNYDVTQTYSNYKKFGSQTKITTIGEAPAEKP